MKKRGQARLPDPETSDLFDRFQVTFRYGLEPNLNELRVRKAGLAPQRSCPAGDPALPPLILDFAPSIAVMF